MNLAEEAGKQSYSELHFDSVLQDRVPGKWLCGFL